MAPNVEADAGTTMPALAAAAGAVGRYARSFGGTIAGGTRETRRTIAGERVLTPPRG